MANCGIRAVAEETFAVMKSLQRKQRTARNAKGAKIQNFSSFAPMAFLTVKRVGFRFAPS